MKYTQACVAKKSKRWFSFQFICEFWYFICESKSCELQLDVFVNCYSILIFFTYFRLLQRLSGGIIGVGTHITVTGITKICFEAKYQKNSTVSILVMARSKKIAFFRLAKVFIIQRVFEAGYENQYSVWHPCSQPRCRLVSYLLPFLNHLFYLALLATYSNNEHLDTTIYAFDPSGSMDSVTVSNCGWFEKCANHRRFIFIFPNGNRHQYLNKEIIDLKHSLRSTYFLGWKLENHPSVEHYSEAERFKMEMQEKE